eukprot:gene34346-42360_t
MDADLIILDLSLRIEQIAMRHPHAHILMSSDVSTLANTGFIIVRNSNWSRQFLRDWIACKDRPGVLNEQLGFEAVYRDRDPEEMLEKIAILSPEVMNSVAPAMGEQLPSHRVLHLAAESDTFRQTVFGHAATNLCVHYVLSENSDAPPPHQLGVSREYLQQTAVTVYRVAYSLAERNLLGEGADHSNDVNISNIINSTTGENIAAQSAEYRATASKYCHAMRYSNRGLETVETLSVRRRAHSLTRQVAARSLLGVLNYRPRRGGLSANRREYTFDLRTSEYRDGSGAVVELDTVVLMLREFVARGSGGLISLLSQCSAAGDEDGATGSTATNTSIIIGAV